MNALHRTTGVAMAVLIGVASPHGLHTAYAQTRVNARAETLAAFSERVAAYAELEKSISAGLPPLKKSDDAVEIADRETAIGNAVRAARAAARPGALLTSAVAKLMRADIKADFRKRTVRGQKMVRDHIPEFHPRVNQSYPSAWPLATFPPSLLSALPTLPEGLEYRLLSNALIIRSIRANLIVDFMLDVF